MRGFICVLLRYRVKKDIFNHLVRRCRFTDSLKQKLISHPVALIAVISQDDASIDESRRLLLVIATDAVNSGMRFSSPKRLELESIGKLPVLYRCGQFKLGVKSAMKNPVLYALRCDGTRIEEIPLEAGGGRLSIQIDTTVLGEPAVFFELAEK